jgi:asparagine synthase (glutamine-hydrolysing)
MPGIAGVIGVAGREQLQAHVAAMLAAMQHEPEWVSGISCAPELGVCAGWVNRAGSYAAAQNTVPGPEGRTLLFCGECIDEDRVTSDSAASLLERYAADGADFVASLNGLFSGLLIDRPGAKVLLFNDRYGCERIYYHQRDGLTFFASEAKALLAVVPELRALDDRGVADFLAYGCTLEGRTLFRGVAQLPGASLWTFGANARGVDKARYFDPHEWEQQTPLDHETFCAELSRTFAQVMPRYLASPSAIGLSVTGGLDTRMILAGMPAERIPRVAYTYAGFEGRTLDCRLGAQAAALRGIRHQTLRIDRDFLTHYGDYLDRTVYLTDGGAGVLGSHEIYYSSLARQLAPIRLTGNFGSEVLRGMSTLKPIGLDSALLDGDFTAGVTTAVNEATAHSCHPVTQAAFREVPWHLFGTLAAARALLTVRTPFLDNDLVQLAYRAPEPTGRSAEPALRLIAASHPQLAALPTDRGHSANAAATTTLVRRMAAGITFKLDYLHKEGLPDWLSPLDGAVDSLSALGLLGWHKYLPYRRWFRHELAPYLQEVVANAKQRRLPYWNQHFLDTVVADHVQGRANRLREIHALLTIEAVDRLFVREAPATRATHPPQLQATTP